jgi:hypothetical protein
MALLQVVAFSLAAVAIAPDETAEALEAVVRQWVAINGELAFETRQWHEKKEWLTTRIQLLEAERDRLQARVDKGRDLRGEGESSRQELVSRVGTMTAELATLATVLDDAEKRAKAWLPFVPEPLRGPLREALDGMVAPAEDPEVIKHVTTRLQAVMAFYASLEELQGGVHLVTDLISLAVGGEREMDVIYLGLGKAYAVSADTSLAAIGHPTVVGWTWVEAPGQAEAIRRAVRMYRKEMPADLVSLPVSVAHAASQGGAQ